MAKHRTHKRCRSRSQKGGDSAWQSVMKMVGSGMTQFNNTFRLNPAQNAATSQSNQLVPIGKPNANNPNVPNPNLTMKGGRRRRGRRCRGKKRGGNGILSQAAVPAALLALNMTAKRRRSRKH